MRAFEPAAAIRSQLLLVEAHVERAVQDGDGRGHCAAVAHALLALLPDRQSLAGREAVRDDRRLQGDDCLPLVRASWTSGEYG